ncbi:protein CYSTEINE-RICH TRANSMEMBRANE MODULE 11-like [Rhododendron vialii]|uniref:protein CYSTEINE-RICH TRANSMEMBRANE MODULE 11-like n=1 Tax=Rhododendron vialii TaxID=182163 RepID=UPI0026604587|nr:protein CYSTEINE-RICH TRANSMEMBRANE MODULE 11-like [Rhododendron vialii]
MNDPKYVYHYTQGYPPQGFPPQGFPPNNPYHPAQGYYYHQGPPVNAPPPQYTAPPRKENGFLEGFRAALGCCCLLDNFCGDPSVCCAF